MKNTSDFLNEYFCIFYHLVPTRVIHIKSHFDMSWSVRVSGQTKMYSYVIQKWIKIDEKRKNRRLCRKWIKILSILSGSRSWTNRTGTENRSVFRKSIRWKNMPFYIPDILSAGAGLICYGINQCAWKMHKMGIC